MGTRRQAPVDEGRQVAGLAREEVEAIIRSYLTRLARRYLPLAIGLAVVALLATTVPSTSPSRRVRTGEAAAGFRAADGTTAASSSGPTQESGPQSAPTTPESVPDQTLTETSRPAGSSARLPVGGSGPTAAKGGERALSGVTCAPGVRQVSWSTYGPFCTPAWKGDNGGSTAPGVTRDAITLSYRIATSGESAALQAAAPSTEKTLDQRTYLADLRTFVAFFNTQFELYGRKVVLKDFAGRGDWIAEYQGQNPEGAQADGAHAHDLGAFGDLSMGRTASTPPYTRALAANRVVSFGGATLSQRAFEALAPYAYSAEPPFDDAGRFFGNLACQRMSQLPASFAGDAALGARPRVFGAIHPENPDYSPAGDIVATKLKSCGDSLTRRVSYSINLATLQSQSANAIAQMKAAGVSTVVCLCDGISGIFFTNAADSQGYHPEWLMMGTSDYTARRWSSSQVRRAFTAGGIQRAERTEAYKVYKLANPSGEPQTPGWTLDLAYQSALLTFSALQSAGPGLTAATVQRGFFGLPDSPSAGDYPAWDFGPKRFTPTGGFPLGYWDPNAPSRVAGGNGAWVACAAADGAYRPWEPAQAYGPKRTQLRCFGK